MLWSLHQQVIGLTASEGFYVTWQVATGFVVALIVGNWALVTWMLSRSERQQDRDIAGAEDKVAAVKLDCEDRCTQIAGEMNRRLHGVSEKLEAARTARAEMRERVHQVELDRERDRRYNAETFARKDEVSAGFHEMKGLIAELRNHIDQKFEQVTRPGGNHA